MRPQIERVFRFVLGLSFLPEKIRAWMFSTGTRAIEVLNAGMLLAWATVMMLDGRVLEMHPYRYSMLFGTQWAHKAWAVAFLIFFVLACCGIACKTCRCKKLGGFAMLASATVWGCVSAGFVASYPPLNTGVLIYALMSLMCWFTGEHLMYTARSGACTDCSEGGNECGAP